MTHSHHIFITGGTGYLGSYAVHELLKRQDVRLTLLVRAEDERAALSKFWKSMQLHMSVKKFWSILPRIKFAPGDITQPKLGLGSDQYGKIASSTDSILHIAAALNRRSEKTCLNVNLRGTLEVLQLARTAHVAGRLERYSHVSTVAVAGERSSEVVFENTAVDWARNDYDPYARTKKFGEHMVRELLPDVDKVFFRPSIVLGDSHKDKTNQFDMVRTFCLLAELPFVPMRGDARLDVVNADYVGDAIATLHMKPSLRHDTYHLSCGTQSNTAEQIARATCAFAKRKPPRFVPPLGPMVHTLAKTATLLPSAKPLQRAGSLLDVFWPYITFDTVFDNARVVEELGRRPVPFVEYCGPLYRYARSVDFKFPYASLPESPSSDRRERAAADAARLS